MKRCRCGEYRQIYDMAIAMLSILMVMASIVCPNAYAHFHNADDKDFSVNLIDNHVYVKTGFDPNILKVDDMAVLTDVDAMKWERVVPREYRGNYAIANLIAEQLGDNRTFLSMKTSPVHEYTLMIPFELDAEDVESFRGMDANVPALYLSGLGDNWEIFINGTMIDSEVHLNEQGEIQLHRSLRSVIIPIDRDILKVGDNSVIFRFIGPYASTDTGLYYASGYFIGDYHDMMIYDVNIITVIFSTIYIFMGIYHFIMFCMRPQDQFNLSYSLFNLTIGIYFISRTSAIYQISHDTAITQRIEYIAMYLLPLLLALFIERIANVKVRWPTKSYMGICAALIALQLVVPVEAFSNVLHLGMICCGIMVIYITIGDTLGLFMCQIRATRAVVDKGSMWITIRNELANTSLGNIFIAIFILCITALFDIFDTAFFHSGIVLMKYGFFMFTIIITFNLARRSVDSLDRVNTENQRLEAAVNVRTIELQEQVKIAELASRAKSDFLANMNHEIRTPINAVIGMTAIGKSTDDVNKKNYSFDRIDNASQHLLSVINDVLDMSKIEANKLELADVKFDIRRSVKQSTDIIQIQTAKKQQSFNSTFDDRIPTWLIGDDQRLRQVITNLLANASKFTPMKGSIEFVAKLNDETAEFCIVEFSITDTGIGISDEQKKKLFRAFQQADNSTARTYGGTGLGLALSKRIVEVMQGDISVTSMPGKGSTFTFTAKLRKPSKQDNAAQKSDFKEAINAGEFSGYTVLLAEDIDINREIVMTFMESTGIQFVTANNGEEALTLFAQNPRRYDMVYMDVQMPIMDGYMATRAIRSLANPWAKAVPIIAMTANVFKEDVDRCLAAGMNAHIGKPISLPDLMVLSRQYLA